MDKFLEEKILKMWKGLPTRLQKVDDQLHEAIVSKDLHKYDGFYSVIKKAEAPQSDNYYG